MYSGILPRYRTDFLKCFQTAHQRIMTALVQCPDPVQMPFIMSVLDKLL